MIAFGSSGFFVWIWDALHSVNCSSCFHFMFLFYFKIEWKSIIFSNRWILLTLRKEDKHKDGYHNNIYKWKTPEGSIYLFSKIFGNRGTLWMLNPKGYEWTQELLSVNCNLFCWSDCEKAEVWIIWTIRTRLRSVILLRKQKISTKLASFASPAALNY